MQGGFEDSAITTFQDHEFKINANKKPNDLPRSSHFVLQCLSVALKTLRQSDERHPFVITSASVGIAMPCDSYCFFQLQLFLLALSVCCRRRTAFECHGLLRLRLSLLRPLCQCVQSHHNFVCQLYKAAARDPPELNANAPSRCSWTCHDPLHVAWQPSLR